MARLPRLVVPGQAHYLILRGHGSLMQLGLFRDAEDRRVGLAALHEAGLAEGVQLHAYALLDGELQLLATPEQAAALGRFIQAFGRRYVSAYNRRYGRSGTLWDGRFRGAVVEPGIHRLQAMLLIDGMSAEPGLTSAQAHGGGARPALLRDLPELWQLGNTPFDREAAYREMLAQGLPSATAQSLRKAALGGWALGSAGFVGALAGTQARPTQPRPRGRPRKTLP